MPPVKTYQTKNLNIASWLLASKKVTFVGVDDTDRHNIQFRFQPKEKAAKLADDYFVGKAIVNAREYAEGRASLLDIINR